MGSWVYVVEIMLRYIYYVGIEAWLVSVTIAKEVHGTYDHVAACVAEYSFVS